MIKIALIACETVGYGESVDGPGLSPCPTAFVCYALGCAAAANLTCLVIIVHNVVGSHILAVMVLHSLVGVADCNVAVGRVTGHFAHFEKEFEVHHIVDDDRAFPTSLSLPAVSHNIPGLDDAGIRTEAGCEGFRGVHKYCVIARDVLEPESVAIAVINHEAHIVVPFQELDFVEDFSVLLSVYCIFLFARELIHIPESAGEETAHPVVHRDEFDFAVFEC